MKTEDIFIFINCHIFAIIVLFVLLFYTFYVQFMMCKWKQNIHLFLWIVLFWYNFIIITIIKKNIYILNKLYKKKYSVHLLMILLSLLFYIFYLQLMIFYETRIYIYLY